MDESVDFMTTQEVARRAGVGATAVKRWTDAGRLACVRTAGGHRRFARSEVERFLGAEPAAGEPEGREPWVGALLEAGDPRALEALFLTERARTGAWHRVAAIAGRALGEVGRLWSAGADHHLRGAPSLGTVLSRTGPDRGRPAARSEGRPARSSPAPRATTTPSGSP